jgi:hypothetical protein
MGFDSIAGEEIMWQFFYKNKVPALIVAGMKL